MRVSIYGVEENYLQQTYSRFYRASEISDQFEYVSTPDGKDDVVTSLFQDAGKGCLKLLFTLS